MQSKITNETATFTQWLAALDAEAKTQEYVGPRFQSRPAKSAGATATMTA